MQTASARRGSTRISISRKMRPAQLRFIPFCLGQPPLAETTSTPSSISGIKGRSEFQWRPLMVGSPLVALCSPSATSRAHLLRAVELGATVALKEDGATCTTAWCFDRDGNTFLRFIIAKADRQKRMP